MKKILTRKDPRVIDLLIAHGVAGYGIYVMLVDYLSARNAMRSRSEIARIAYELHTSAELVRSVLEDFGLFTLTDDTTFHNLASKPKKQPQVPQPEAETPSAAEMPDLAPESAPEPPKSIKVSRITRKVKLNEFLRQRGLYPSPNPT